MKLPAAKKERTDRRRQLASRAIAAGAAALMASCAAPPPPSKPVAASKPPIPQTPPEERTPQAGRSFSVTMNGYKRDVAKQVYRSNPDALFDGAPPPLLKSVIVLSIRIDAQGRPQQISVLRSNGYKDLEQAAIKSLRNAAPLPTPNRFVMKGGAVEFVETWLFQKDGRFQIRSLAEPQAD